MHYIKIKLILIACCLCVIGASQLYIHGFDAGLKQSDVEAFDAYTVFAKQLQHKPQKVATVWDVIK